MIKVEDFAESVEITGYPEQIAMELEEAARAVRKALCKRFGKEKGNGFFDFIIANSKKEKVGMEKEAVELHRRLEAEHPEDIALYKDSQVAKALQECLRKRGVSL